MSAQSPARSGRIGVQVATVALCSWILIPLYLIIVNALSAPSQVTGFPKAFVPSFDLESLAFFWNYAGVARALLNSILVAALTMLLAIGLGAPAGYALARFRFRGKGSFPPPGPDDPGLRCRSWPCGSPSSTSASASTTASSGLRWSTPFWHCRSRS